MFWNNKLQCLFSGRTRFLHHQMFSSHVGWGSACIAGLCNDFLLNYSCIPICCKSVIYIIYIYIYINQAMMTLLIVTCLICRSLYFLHTGRYRPQEARFSDHRLWLSCWCCNPGWWSGHWCGSSCCWRPRQGLRLQIWRGKCWGFEEHGGQRI